VTSFLFNTRNHPKGFFPRPTFEIRDGRMYTTVHHPDGPNQDPWYRLEGGLLFPVETHPQKAALDSPWYRMEGRLVYADAGHPHGRQDVPWFEVRDSDEAIAPATPGVSWIK
jgi:hypothetical protein